MAALIDRDQLKELVSAGAQLVEVLPADESPGDPAEMIALDAKCEKCGKQVEVCDLCEDPECKHVVCHDCLAVALDERKPQPHEHGG